MTDELGRAVEEGGGRLSDPGAADALVWTSPMDPEGLKDVLESSRARWVQLPFAGIESFLEAGAIDRGRVWTCTKGAYGHACAEHALCLMLAAARRLHEHLRRRSWRPGGLGSPERLLKGATALVFGTGGIGAALLAMLQPLGMRALAVNRAGRAVAGADVTVPTERLPELLPSADYVVLAAALTPETRRLFGPSLLDRMNDQAWLINVARGALVDTDALVDALRAGSIAGAALDVTDPEPLPDDHPLWSMDNVIITPHVANTWDMALPELAAMVRRNVARFARGEELEGLVDRDLGY